MDTKGTKRRMLKVGAAVATLAAVLIGSSGCLAVGTSCDTTSTSEVCHVW
jgi:hypothetical protein